VNRKEMQEKRKRGYFLEAAKKVVREEGVSELTVKKVADLAGYAPATLYNYFTDVNELLFHTAVAFFGECKEYVLKNAESAKDPKERIIGLATAYSCYFLENPKVYHLAFLHDIRVPGEYAEGYVPEIVKLTAENLMEYGKAGLIDLKDVETILGLIANSIHGNLLFYIKERGGLMTREEIIGKIEKEVRFVLREERQESEDC